MIIIIKKHYTVHILYFALLFYTITPVLSHCYYKCKNYHYFRIITVIIIIVKLTRRNLKGYNNY